MYYEIADKFQQESSVQLEPGVKSWRHFSLMAALSVEIAANMALW
jgi:hypothetical protein